MPQGVIMRPEKYRTSRLVRWFEKMRILTWERVAQALGNPSRITVFRKLAQLERRYEAIRQAHERGAVGRPEVPQELHESIHVLLSVLNEKQRRLYLGLESIRLGHGGDFEVARMAGVNVKTVAQGRRQLLARNVTAERIRQAGVGRPALKKKPK